MSSGRGLTLEQFEIEAEFHLAELEEVAVMHAFLASD
jgi:hypothetical protein